MQRIEFLSRQLRNVARGNILINSNKSCLDEPTANWLRRVANAFVDKVNLH